jgi:hypothetical protein
MTLINTNRTTSTSRPVSGGGNIEKIADSGQDEWPVDCCQSCRTPLGAAERSGGVGYQGPGNDKHTGSGRFYRVRLDIG